MRFKPKFEDYTEQEYLELLTAIFDGHYNSELEHDEMVNAIIATSEHPKGSDIIYYPDDNVDETPLGLLNFIKQWRAKNGKPGFKSG